MEDSDAQERRRRWRRRQNLHPVIKPSRLRWIWRATFLLKETQNETERNILSLNYSNDGFKHKVHGKFKLPACHCIYHKSVAFLQERCASPCTCGISENIKKRVLIFAVDAIQPFALVERSFSRSTFCEGCAESVHAAAPVQQGSYLGGRALWVSNAAETKALTAEVWREWWEPLPLC